MENTMNKQTLSIASGILLCAGTAFGQTNPSSQQYSRRSPIQPTPEQSAARDAKLKRFSALNKAGFTALHEGRYSEAEENARESLAVNSGQNLLAPELLAEALDAQGKNDEALAAYKILVDQGSEFPRILLPYALLLLKDGKYKEAVAAYNKTSPYIAFGDLIEKTSRFTTTDPQPKELAAAIHVGLGLTYISSADWAGNSQEDKAMLHFQQALTLSPKSSLANYYYGFGLKRLGRRAEAQGAFKKAAALDDGDVKAAALKELPGAMQPR
jgi:tetratricopeptide (TPR) repeat protein